VKPADLAVEIFYDARRLARHRGNHNARLINAAHDLLTLAKDTQSLLRKLNLADTVEFERRIAETIAKAERGKT
jgi:hypothetical protein